MARLVALSAVREAVRQRYDLPDFSTSTFVTLVAVNSAINESLQALYAILLDAWGDDYFTKLTSVSTTANQGYTAYPTNFLRLQGIAWQRGTDDYVPLERASVDDMPDMMLSARAWTTTRPKYRLTLDGIRWTPAPNAVYTVWLHYVQLPAALSADGDTFDAGPSWDEWVVMDVCAKIAQREEKSIAEWLAKRSDVEARIKSQAPGRDEWQPEQVRDIAGYGSRLGDQDYRNALLTRRR
jgi:hypothetical protein